ncbi:MAG: hypothetical protein HC846_10720 [Blastocatellia bacterium]|nr:hypothetical protein [Blastocatellia bacterium]
MSPLFVAMLRRLIFLSALAPDPMKREGINPYSPLARAGRLWRAEVAAAHGLRGHGIHGGIDAAPAPVAFVVGEENSLSRISRPPKLAPNWFCR